MLDEKKAAQAIETLDVGRYLTLRHTNNMALLETLAGMLQNVLPAHTKVSRSFWASRLKEVTVDFDSAGFRIAVDANSGVTCFRRQIAKGIGIKNETTNMGQMLTELTVHLRNMAEKDGKLHEALVGFMTVAQSQSAASSSGAQQEPQLLSGAERGITIPPQALERLKDMRGEEGGKRRLWSSDLSVDELVVLDGTGFKPAGMVMGSSIYRIGYQMSNWGQNMELGVLTGALYHARENAMERLRQEAEALGAHGVVGVRLELKNWNFVTGSIEYIAFGTAVYCTREGWEKKFLDADGRPFTSTLSVQDFYKLLKIGKRPVALVLGNCVYHVAHRTMMSAIGSSWSNIELENFTSALYEAREIAQRRMDREAEKDEANGIVDLRIEHGNFWNESHVIEFMAIGTAVRDIEEKYEIEGPPFVLTLNA